ncbi:Early nodulin-93 [Linum perenne]
MGIPSDMRNYWAQSVGGSACGSYRNADHTVKRSSSFPIASPDEKRSKAFAQDSVFAGFKAAAVVAVITTGPVIVACRKIPWAKRNLNYTAQALIISSASIATFFVTADKATLERARSNTRYDKTA